MGGKRVRRGQGDHLGGASQITRGAYSDQSAKPVPRGKMSRVFSDPMEDTRIGPGEGSRIAHVGSKDYDSPTIYTEKAGGRAKQRGKSAGTRND